MAHQANHYPRHTDISGVPSSPDLPALERQVLAYWARDDTFAASIDQREAGTDGANEYVFYDGPPFANGLPHYGHLLTGYVKDVVPRYQTMRGKRVERRFGWDTHGLPAELEAMDQLGIKTKDEILDMGIEAFNAASRASVLKYTDEWRDYVTRQARWVDFDNDYKTLNPDYMESVLWAFKKLYDKGLVYEGFRVLPYCWNDQTPLSNHELRMDEDVYQSRQDPSVTVGYRLETGELALIWTTTPWTMPSNLLVVVGEDIDYVVVEAPHPGDDSRTERYILAEERLEAYARELAGGDADLARSRIVARLKGADLVGRSYTPPFTYFQGHEGAHRIVADDYVTTTDGTGLVHNAGAFGEEDKQTTDREGIEPVRPVGTDGAFTAPVEEYAGMLVFDANLPIIEHLKAATTGHGDSGSVTTGTVLLRRETYDHSYPHCWRCRQPLIYMGVSSWFVEVTKFKDRMVELNQQITWVPEHVKDGQFGKWLSNARDWSISRNRFWGTPIPVWRSDNPDYPRTDVYGSLAEIERDFGRLPRNADGEVDLHRPFVDELTRPNPDDPTGSSTMRRIEDVLDVWFDSGSMSFAQVHYPYQNAEWFEHHFPADFIVEYINQTRGWFYTLHILATALFDRPAFSACVSHGIVLGNDGQKMSKSLRNYPDVREVFDRNGSDAMRWFLMASPILRGGNLVVTEDGIRDAVRTILLPLWSTWYFFSLYANTTNDGAGYQAKPVTTERVAQLGEMDQYLLARTHDLALAVTTALDEYDIAGAAELIRDHLDVLTNWYVRTQRDRFWAEDADAYDTLWTALEVLCRLMAPLAPLVTEEIWRGLTGARSVHLTDWPVRDGSGIAGSVGDAVMEDGLVPNADLVAAMDQARAAVSATHGLRKAHQLRVRQPLRRVYIAVEEPGAVQPFSGLIAEELNVKEVELLRAGEEAAHRFGVTTRLSVNARAAGPRLGKDVQTAIKGARAGDWAEQNGTVVAGGIELHDGEYELVTQVAEAADGRQAVAILPGGGFAVLELALDEQLRAEGYARDVVRQVQDARKSAGLHVADRITLTLTAPAQWAAAVQAHADFIAAETLATSVQVHSGNGADLGVDLARDEEWGA
ncbi:isoleucine--tRNA ligase [Pseudactinotalea sp. Z1748]|uniref:isoleucine--tRNA ligase n=1 Tax=Pseudactinotalea sp. Z1748 TaxID=3413027 RepID=UPI003C7AA63F